MKKEKGTFGWVFIFAGQKKSGYIASVIFAVIGAAFQILPFFVMAQVIGKLLAGNKDLAGYLIDCAVMAAFWLLRVLLHSLSTAQSHKATFAVLGNIRKQGLAKLAKMPLGDVQTKGSGELKNILVERVDSIEPTLAHAIPEMSSNAAVALATLIYLFVIDWRILYKVGVVIDPVTRFFGLKWQAFLAFCASAISKESLLGVLNTLYGAGGSLVSSIFGAKVSAAAAGGISEILAANFTKAEGLAFIFAISFNMPCVSALAATAREAHSVRWTAKIGVFYTLASLLIACIVYHIGVLLF